MGIQVRGSLGVLWVLGEVGELMRVSLHVVQFGGAILVAEVGLVGRAQAVVASVEG